MSGTSRKIRVTKKDMDKRRQEVDYTGWDTNIFLLNPDSVFEVESDVLEELWINIIDPSYISKPCWTELLEASSDHTTKKVVFDRNAFDEGKIIECHTFLFDDQEKAKKLALRVQRSAKDNRKEEVREWREAIAEGFHTNECIEHIFEIQQGRCYYSGDPLIKNPSNYSKDHIVSLCRGGSEWPANLALTLKSINTWKGGANTKNDTLNWLAQKRGGAWLKKQLVFCEKVDKLRSEYDQQFKKAIEDYT